MYACVVVYVYIYIYLCVGVYVWQFVYPCLCVGGDMLQCVGYSSYWVAQLVERRTRDPKDPRFEPRQEHKKNNLGEFFRVKKCVLTRRCAQPPCYQDKVERFFFSRKG